MPLSFSTAADRLRGRLTRPSMVSSDDHLEVTVPQFNVAEAKARLSQLIQKALAGEDVVVAKDNKPLVRARGLKRTARRRQPARPGV
jgi:hypothetical protein